MKYQIKNGTYYHKETPKVIINALEHARINNIRIRLYYGDTATGRDWGEIHDVTGFIGRSMGPVKIPILLFNRRSIGGGAILDHCVIRIRYYNKQKGGDFYRHIKYHKTS